MSLLRPIARCLRSGLACFALASGVQAGAQGAVQGAAAPHHTASGFQNNDVDNVSRGLVDLLRWRWQAWREGLPPPPATPTPVQAPTFFKARLSILQKGAGTVPHPHNK